ncbi:hypothetical protein ACFY3M_48735 [Streptomyces mirabilis]|uniref:hypothetical protein n=1 Tax=Streptomyces mirabilis TaxID=68239 RepID=UPI0036BA367D
MLVFYAVPLVSLFLVAAGSVAYLLWAALRRPSRQVRWAVIGAGVAVLGYAGAVAYGLAFTDPVQVCGQKTLDNDFPLVRVRVDAFPPDVACYWSDSGAYGPSHPTVLGTWVMWAGTGVLVVALSVILIGRRSRASRWVRAGAIWSPLVAAMIWVTGIGPAMELSRTELYDECLHDKTVPPETKLIRIDVLDIERTVFPPSLTCTYSDSEADLLAPERTGLLGCGVAFVAFTGAALSQAARAGRPKPAM